ncbi:nodulation protein NfeD [Stieleria sp. JC731]|uniref:NfeD family protein n=1 Tax=Pirellulaceae TaxID=2691357 RepID=UPI001E4A68EA|nr:NfeD family protein [Stieleria sp. JC731]MCC9601516.1 nodulation protein NfeD [Stieleria sp. JC731]
MQLLYAFGLLGLYFILLIGEFFLPTGGTLGIGAAITAIASIMIAFTHGPISGIVVTTCVCVSTPVLLYFAVRIWPQTPIGKIILNRTPGQIDLPTESLTRKGEKRKDLVGKIGIAKSNLLPAGLIVIDGQRLDAVSQGVPIDAGTEVIVISAIAGKLKVRPITDADQVDRPSERSVDQISNVTQEFGQNDQISVQAIETEQDSAKLPQSSLETFDFSDFQDDPNQSN